MFPQEKRSQKCLNKVFHKQQGVRRILLLLFDSLIKDSLLRQSNRTSVKRSLSHQASEDKLGFHTSAVWIWIPDCHYKAAE